MSISDSKFLIGQPAKYPTALADALKQLFERHQSIKRAYLAQIFNPAQDREPHVIVGIEASEGYEAALNEASAVAQRVHAPNPPVDFIRITQSGPIEDYFLKKARPFFER